MTTFVLKNLCQLFDKYAVARTEHEILVKSTTKTFSNFVAFSENPNFKLESQTLAISFQIRLSKIYHCAYWGFLPCNCSFLAQLNKPRSHNSRLIVYCPTNTQLFSAPPSPPFHSALNTKINKFKDHSPKLA